MKWLIAASTLALTACAPTLYVTYRTDPPGAMIYEGAKALGYAPLTAPYNVGDGFEHSKCLMLNPISARWVSGAETKPTPIKACLDHGGWTQELTFVRPNIAGRELDVQWAIHLQEQQVAQKQADAAAWQAALSSYQSVAPTTVRCVTNQVGTMIVTNCF
ncbi:MAG TPA: hypothetical protein VFB32_15235 [Rudaea sp.]|nr:hypothetical protein [Rudaea sp.]